MSYWNSVLLIYAGIKNINLEIAFPAVSEFACYLDFYLVIFSTLSYDWMNPQNNIMWKSLF